MSESKTIRKAVLSKWDIVALTSGIAVGEGIIMFVGIAMLFAGTATWLAYLLSVVLGFILITPITLYSSAVTVKGSYYTIVTTLWSKRAAGYYIMMSIFSLLGMAAVGMTLGFYVNLVIPSLQPNWVAMAGFTIFFITNLLGVDVIARVQKVGMIFLIGGLLGFIILGLPMVNWSEISFASPSFMTSAVPGMSGAKGFLFSICILTFLAIPVNSAIVFSNHAKNPTRDIPFATYASLFLMTIF